MINLDKIAEELFNKIRGRYPKVTLGDKDSTITNVPQNARFFDFEFTPKNKVNVTVDEKSLTVLYNNKLLDDDNGVKKEQWYGFMKELRSFAKKRMLNFDARDITKTNLDRRDYEYMSKNRPGEEPMSESKMYGTSKTSFQDLGNARLVVKHRGAVNQELPAGRTQQIDSIYIESDQGERFKYPYRHLNGARAMARHVSEGGNAYDTFGKHIVSLSEELSKLRQFKTYMNRSTVMAEGLAGYMDIVNERIDSVKDTIFKLQKETNYKEAFESFEETVMEEVPSDVSSNWIDELTIRQFNEELKGVFPYIYNLVKEGTKPVELGPDDILGENLDESEMDFSDKNKELSLWLAKYDEYTGKNGDALPMGWIKGMTSTGIVSDGYEQDEITAFEKKIGKEEFEWEDADWDEFSKPENSPITSKMFADLAKIIGTDDHDEDVARAVSDALGIGEGLDMEDEYASHLDNVVANSKHEQGPEIEEGNEFAQKVQALKAKGAKPGTKFKTSDGEEHTLEDAITKAGLSVTDFWTEDELAEMQKDEKTPLGEFILSYFDKHTGQFPKGETAVLTMVEKQYGDDMIAPAKQFIEKVNEKVSEVMGFKASDESVSADSNELNDISRLAGV